MPRAQAQLARARLSFRWIMLDLGCMAQGAAIHLKGLVKRNRMESCGYDKPRSRLPILGSDPNYKNAIAKRKARIAIALLHRQYTLI